MNDFTFLGTKRINKNRLRNTTEYKRLKNILNTFEKFSSKHNIKTFQFKTSNKNKNNFMYMYFRVPKNHNMRNNINKIYIKHKNTLNNYLKQKLNRSPMLRRAQRKFTERFYTPPHGKGYLLAMKRLQG